MEINWPKHPIAALAISFCFALCYVLLLVGPAVVNPTDISWTKTDSAMYYLGWGMFRHDSAWHFPVTMTTHLGYPIGQSVALLDIIPLWALLLKPISAFLPLTFQYFGIHAVVSFTLQFYFAARIIAVLVGERFLIVVVAALFFLTAPPMTLRMTAHFALVSHWLLLAALYLYIRATAEDSSRRKSAVVAMAGLSVLAITINPYLAAMTVAILLAAVVANGLERTGHLPYTILCAGCLCGLSLMMAFVLGLVTIRAGDLSAAGFRHYSLNILGPIDPNMYGSMFIKRMPSFTDGQYEGYSYLGAGVLMLCIVVFSQLIDKGTIALNKVTLMRSAPLVVCCIALTCFALSTRITIGKALLVDLDPSEKLTPALSVFRSSGRMFWPTYYVLLIAILVAVFRLLRVRTALAVTAVAFLVQSVDTIPLRRFVYTAVNSTPAFPLRSPFWRDVGKTYKHLVVLPARQCTEKGPGGSDGDSVFGRVAVDQRMTINSYFAGRLSARSLQYHCEEALNRVASGVLDKETIYVVTPTIAALIEAGVSARDVGCKRIDGFSVCAMGINAADGALKTASFPVLHTYPRIEIKGNPDIGAIFVAGWHELEPELIWSTGRGIIAFTVPPAAPNFTRLRLSALALVGPKGLSYSVDGGDNVVIGKLPGRDGGRIERMTIDIPLRRRQSKIFMIEIVTHQPHSPADLQLSQDQRRLGLGVLSMDLSQ